MPLAASVSQVIRRTGTDDGVRDNDNNACVSMRMPAETQ